MLFTFFNFVQQCIQISTRINSTSVHTYILRLFYIASSIRIFILINPIFNTCKSCSLYIHTLLILNTTSKSKYQVVHEQKFKDLLSSTKSLDFFVFTQ